MAQPSATSLRLPNASKTSCLLLGGMASREGSQRPTSNRARVASCAAGANSQACPCHTLPMMLPLAALLTSSLTYTCTAIGLHALRTGTAGWFAAPAGVRLLPAVLCRRGARTLGLLAALAMSASVSQSRRPASSESGDSLPLAPRGVEGSLLVGTLATCRQRGGGAVADAG